eukprot:2607-Heterococcus_DN1.PRE.8
MLALRVCCTVLVNVHALYIADSENSTEPLLGKRQQSGATAGEAGSPKRQRPRTTTDTRATATTATTAGSATTVNARLRTCVMLCVRMCTFKSDWVLR